jgi:hypothetical protein
MSLECHLSVETDGSVRFVLTVTNRSDERVSLTFPNSGTADFAVLDGAREVWRWSNGRAFAQVLRTVELAPGEQVAFEGEWSDPVSGAYEAVGELRPTRRDCTARVPFSV